MAKIETVVVPIIGAREVSVMRRVRLVMDCGCFNHRAVEFDLIIPGGGRDYELGRAYIRSANADSHFHTSDRNGPISVSIDSVKTE